MMKRYILLFWGVFFSLQSFTASAYSHCQFQDIRKGGTTIPMVYTPDMRLKTIVSAGNLGSTSCNETLSVNMRIKRQNGAVCTINAPTGDVTCEDSAAIIGKIYYPTQGLKSTGEETATCWLFNEEQYEGSAEHAFQAPYCINTGVSTGGSSPKPLLCQTKAVTGFPNGTWAHVIDGEKPECSAVSPPDPKPDPDPDPDPDQDPDPDPDPNPNPGTPGGGGQPSSGSTGGTTGTSGTNAVNLVMDFKPVTERLDLLRADEKAHANYLGQQITNGTAATNSLKPLLEAIGAKTDAVAAAVKDGTAQIKGELNTLNNTGKAIEGAIKDGNTALGEKLDGIKEGIDKLTEGEPIDGTAAANSTNLPDYDDAVRRGVEHIQNTIADYADDSGINNLTDRNAVTGMFSAAESFGDVFDIARSGCSPIAFGSHGKFNICGAAPTISMVLEMIIWALTALFIFHFIGGLLTRERLT